MTPDEVRTLRFEPSIFAQLTDGGHLQAKYNWTYGVAMVDIKQNRKSAWRRYFALCPTHRICRGPDVKELSLEELYEALGDVEYVGTGPGEAKEQPDA